MGNLRDPRDLAVTWASEAGHEGWGIKHLGQPLSQSAGSVSVLKGERLGTQEYCRISHKANKKTQILL